MECEDNFNYQHVCLSVRLSIRSSLNQKLVSSHFTQQKKNSLQGLLQVRSEFRLCDWRHSLSDNPVEYPDRTAAAFSAVPGAREVRQIPNI